MEPSDQHDVKVEMQNGKFFVKKIVVRPGDTIRWSSKDTDFRIWFPKGRDPLNIGASDPIRKEGTGNRDEVFELIVPDCNGTPVKGTYPYSIFCYENNTMAEGNSSPEMIIKR